jgi:AraC family transcriptional regulator of adaptative response / DNA-3-methyladenine glycosylase II
MRTRDSLDPDIVLQALDARDARFDGVFFVGITTTQIYCRPVCPSRFARRDHRRIFPTAAAAESSGYRPCLRCRPELAPGRAPCDAVARLAYAAAYRISMGALNGHAVGQMAADLGVSERHLRRAVQREMGVSPLQLAQTHRLLLAKRLLADTTLPVTTVAYASGFQSLRRFNSIFHERYGLSPTALRRPAERRQQKDFVALTLAYRAPLAWDALIALLRCEAVPGLEVVEGKRYGRTVLVTGRRGVVFVEDAGRHVRLEVSLSLVPVLMPLLARLRNLFDLDAEPAIIDACLGQGGLAHLVEQRRGLRLIGAFEGFELALRALLTGSARPGTPANELLRRVVTSLGEPMETGIPSLTHLAPTAERLMNAAPELVALGVSPKRAQAITAVARLQLEPGGDAGAARAALMRIDGIDEQLATTILMRTLRWPDAFPSSDAALQRAAGLSDASSLLERAETWRPWRAYAALHLWLADTRT